MDAKQAFVYRCISIVCRLKSRRYWICLEQKIREVLIKLAEVKKCQCENEKLPIKGFCVEKIETQQIGL